MTTLLVTQPIHVPYDLGSKQHPRQNGGLCQTPRRCEPCSSSGLRFRTCASGTHTCGTTNRVSNEVRGGWSGPAVTPQAQDLTVSAVGDTAPPVMPRKRPRKVVQTRWRCREEMSFRKTECCIVKSASKHDPLCQTSSRSRIGHQIEVHKPLPLSLSSSLSLSSLSHLQEELSG